AAWCCADLAATRVLLHDDVNHLAVLDRLYLHRFQLFDDAGPQNPQSLQGGESGELHDASRIRMSLLLRGSEPVLELDTQVGGGGILVGPDRDSHHECGRILGLIPKTGTESEARKKNG